MVTRKKTNVIDLSKSYRIVCDCGESFTFKGVPPTPGTVYNECAKCRRAMRTIPNEQGESQIKGVSQ